jgi:hypothetical protein
VGAAAGLAVINQLACGWQRQGQSTAEIQEFQRCTTVSPPHDVRTTTQKGLISLYAGCFYWHFEQATGYHQLVEHDILDSETVEAYTSQHQLNYVIHLWSLQCSLR